MLWFDQRVAVKLSDLAFAAVLLCPGSSRLFHAVLKLSVVWNDTHLMVSCPAGQWKESV